MKTAKKVTRRSSSAPAKVSRAKPRKAAGGARRATPKSRSVAKTPRKARPRSKPFRLKLPRFSIFERIKVTLSGLGKQFWSWLGAFLLIVGLAWVYGPKQPRSVVQADSPWHARFAAASKLSRGERMAYWAEQIWSKKLKSEDFAELGKPPVISDDAPLVPSKYNCTTFVETLAALSRSSRPGEFYRNLLAIRYRDGETTYFGRNHFPEADWIPNNVRAGILKDITREVGQASGVEYGHLAKMIKRGEWHRSLAKKGQVNRTLASASLPAAWATPVMAKVEYLPIDDVEKFVPHVPVGAVLNLVRVNDERKPVLITHQGIVIADGSGRRFLRHSLPNGTLRTVPLPDYLISLAKRNERWPLAGVNLNLPR